MQKSLRPSAKFVCCAAAGLVFAILQSCSTIPELAVGNSENQVEKKASLDPSLLSLLESQIAIRKASDVQVFLTRLENKLIAGDELLANRGAGVQLIGDVQGKWQSLGYPGNRIYLSIGLLKELEFENEVAGQIALELAHLRIETLRIRLAEEGDGKPEQTVFFGPAGVFRFRDRYQVVAADHAVGILYRAGIDPRGVTAVLAKCKNNPAKNPYEDGTLDRMIEASRRAIAVLSPLRNPLVRTPGFLAIQKRIRLL